MRFISIPKLDFSSVYKYIPTIDDSFDRHKNTNGITRYKSFSMPVIGVNSWNSEESYDLITFFPEPKHENISLRYLNNCKDTGVTFISKYTIINQECIHIDHIDWNFYNSINDLRKIFKNINISNGYIAIVDDFLTEDEVKILTNHKKKSLNNKLLISVGSIILAETFSFVEFLDEIYTDFLTEKEILKKIKKFTKKEKLFSYLEKNQ